MAATTTYPGVYLSEDTSINVSVSNLPTAVPLFVRRKSTDKYLKGSLLCIDSWADFQNSLVDDHSTGYGFYTSIKLWFMNGGGRCYLAVVSEVTTAVRKYDDITLVVAAGTMADAFGDFTTLVSEGYRIYGLFDYKDEKITSSMESETVMADYSASACASVYYPWVVNSDGSFTPPSAVAAVAIAITDRNRGVWKAPANVVINGTVPKYPVSDDLQGRFNQGKALNMIRTLPNVGTVVWGARTLDDSDNWRYIPVRRLFNSVERDIQKTLNKLVFEPNSQPTWQKVKAAVDNYLHSLWKKGALVGNKQEEAWFVQIGKDITMTGDDINQGKMIVKIGLAAVRPAEFIILQLSQDIAQ